MNEPIPSADVVYGNALKALDTPRAKDMLPVVSRAVQQSPADFRLWHVLGLIFRQIDRREEAISALERAAVLSPSSALIAHGIARTKFEAGLPSVEAYAQALQLAPGDPSIIAGMTSALVADGQFDVAINGLNRIVDRSPTWAAGQRLLSDLRWMNGEREGFTSNFADGLAAHPSSFELRREQLHALIHAEHWPDVIAAAAAGRETMGNDRLFDVSEAIAFAELGELETADRLFAPLQNSDDPALMVRMIRHSLRSGRADVAANQIEPWLKHAEARNFWPYASIAWRMTDDPRWDWLEGDASFVGVYDIADRIPSLATLADTLRALHNLKGQPLAQSVRGGTQTDGNLFQRIDPVIVELREAIRSVVEEYVARLPAPDPDHPLLGVQRSPITFSGSWSVRLQRGGNHANHVHPMGWISSALYIALPDDLGCDQAGWLTLGEPQAQLQLPVSAVRTVEPKPGRLALFPSTMWHGTRPFHAGERLTVAFDVALP